METVEIIWQLEPHPLTDERVVRPLVEALSAMPGFAISRYDMNQREQWRPFDLEHAVVDALTQRTQLLSLADEQRGRVALIAMGKHGEQPAMLMRWSLAPASGPGGSQAQGLEAELVRLTAGWDALFASVPVQQAFVTSAAWRAALLDADVPTLPGGGQLGMVHGWTQAAAPAGLERLSPLKGPTALRRAKHHVALVASETGRVEDREHADELHRMHTTLGLG